MTRLAFLLAASSQMLFACATELDGDPQMEGGEEATISPEDLGNGDAGDDGDEMSTELDSTTQAVSAPTILKAGSSTASVGGSLAPSLEVSGGRELGAYLIAKYTTGRRSTGTFTGEVTITAAPGAAFTYALLGSGPGYSGKQLRIERLPGSTELRAASGDRIVTCGTLGSAATKVTVALSIDSRRFDVKLDGAPTACTGLPTRVAPPMVGFQMQDASNEGYGGLVRFDGMTVR